MEKEKLSCVFALKAKRPPKDYIPEEVEQLTKLERRYLSRGGHQQTLYYSLTDENGNEESFTLQQGIFAFLSGIGSMFGAATLLNLVAGPLSFLGILAPGFGKIVRTGNVSYDDRLDFSISREKYDQMYKTLSKGGYRPFNILFYNCATYGVGFARKHGLQPPKRGLITMPFMLSSHVRKSGQSAAEMDVSHGTPVSLLDRLKSPKRLGLDA